MKIKDYAIRNPFKTVWVVLGFTALLLWQLPNIMFWALLNL